MQTINMMACKVVLLLVMLILPTASTVESGQKKERTDSIPSYFPYPTALRPQVEFWKKIFAVHSRYQVVIHDSETMQVYKVLDFRRLWDEAGLDEATISEIKRAQVKLEVERLRVTLLKLQRCVDSAAKCDALSTEEQRIWNMYKGNDDPDRFRQAAQEDRLRSQTGIRERFREGLRLSGRYMQAMEAIFKREGLPVELTRLPLIESSFHIGARSKVGAAGIWQFMPATGRMYAMRVNNVVDERLDPLMATEAAARLLKSNYERLGTWPLAITAYNHGPNGMVNAVNTTGSEDIVTIIRYYRGRAFGFSSRNFYPEFLAALLIEKDSHQHFGPLEVEAPLDYEEAYIEHPISLSTAAQYAGADRDALRALNPALDDAVHKGKIPVPRGYQLRLPAGTVGAFLPQYAAWMEEEKTRIATTRKARVTRLAAKRKGRVSIRKVSQGKSKSATTSSRRKGMLNETKVNKKPDSRSAESTSGKPRG